MALLVNLLASLGVSSAAAAQHDTTGHAPFAVLTGIVGDSVHMIPLAGAEVIVVSTGRSGRTNEDGMFRIDSIPAGTYTIEVRHPLLDSLGITLASAGVPLAANKISAALFQTPSIATLSRSYCDASSDAGAAAASILLGRVTDPSTGAPLQGVTVTLRWRHIDLSTNGLREVPAVKQTTSAADGLYAICGLGNNLDATLEASDQGRSTPPVRVSFGGERLLLRNLSPGTVASVASQATDTIPAQLARVDVRAVASRNAFEERRRMGLGHFLTQEQIDARHAMQFTDLLESVPTIALGHSSRGTTVLPRRGGGGLSGSCVTLAVDGIVVSTEGAGAFDNAVQPRDVAAVEIYTTATLPGQLSALMGKCDVLIAVWTKGTRPH